mmetsp:Transcript_8442/g.13499  ORF Transcript_8442/g.13499 Transcript_8442/m.13499 type:complete len:323 (-) Transcript_8442:43-1011(-)
MRGRTPPRNVNTASLVSTRAGGSVRSPTAASSASRLSVGADRDKSDVEMEVQNFDIANFFNLAGFYSDDSYCNMILAMLEQATPGSILRSRNMVAIMQRRWKDDNVDCPEVTAEREQAIVEQVMFTLPSVDADGNIRWDNMSYRLPTEKDKQSYIDRTALLKFLDRDNTGRIPIDQMKIGLSRIVSMPGMDDPEHILDEVCSLAQRAVADLMLQGVPRNSEDILAKEFRVFLMFLQGYLDLWEIFYDIDRLHDEMITLEEFATSAMKLREWGLKDPALNKNPEHIFNQIDEDGSGFISFGEFADYCVRKGMMDDLATDLRSV